MSLPLPKPIADYFAADAADADAVARCFTADAIVIDENRTHLGHQAIGAWKAETTERYRYTSMPIAIDGDGSRPVVTAHLVGDFPGSPVDLRYDFTLEGNAIVRLEIAA